MYKPGAADGMAQDYSVVTDGPGMTNFPRFLSVLTGWDGEGKAEGREGEEVDGWERQQSKHRNKIPGKIGKKWEKEKKKRRGGRKE